MQTQKISYKRHRFPPQIIAHCRVALKYGKRRLAPTFQPMF